MKIYISYFYQIRNFPPDLIPISTAKWDPQWFHKNRGLNYIFKDNRGIINGLRCELLAPNEYCGTLCKGKDYCNKNNINSTTCSFLKEYYKQIQKINFNNFIKDLQDLVVRLHMPKANIALIVYEAPNNKCSERDKIIKWFKDHNYDIEEF